MSELNPCGVYECQISARFDGYKHSVIHHEAVPGWFFGSPAYKETTKKRMVVSTESGYVFPDDAVVLRTFSYQRRIVRAMHNLIGDKAKVTLYLDDHEVITVDAAPISFDPSLENGPIAHILMEKNCKRDGSFSSRGVYRQYDTNYESTTFQASMTFRDHQQMNEYFIAGGATEVVTRTHRVKSSEGIGLLGLAAGVAIGANL